jgi:hypothetical protein
MKTTVQRGYLMDQDNASRVLVDSRGQVYAEGAWFIPVGSRVVTVPGTYDRWMDVPEAWLGHAPWWR